MRQTPTAKIRSFRDDTYARVRARSHRWRACRRVRSTARRCAHARRRASRQGFSTMKLFSCVPLHLSVMSFVARNATKLFRNKIVSMKSSRLHVMTIASDGRDGRDARAVHGPRDERRNSASSCTRNAIPRVWIKWEVTSAWIVRMGWGGEEGGAAGTSRRACGDGKTVGADAGGASTRRPQAGVHGVDLLPA